MELTFSHCCWSNKTHSIAKSCATQATAYSMGSYADTDDDLKNLARNLHWAVTLAPVWRPHSKSFDCGTLRFEDWIGSCLQSAGAVTSAGSRMRRFGRCLLATACPLGLLSLPSLPSNWVLYLSHWKDPSDLLAAVKVKGPFGSSDAEGEGAAAERGLCLSGSTGWWTRSTRCADAGGSVESLTTPGPSRSTSLQDDHCYVWGGCLAS